MLNPMLRWYAIYAQPGHENKVKSDLEQRLRNERLSHYVRDIVIPTEQVMVQKGAQRVPKEQRSHPGYILLHMDLPRVFSAIKNTKGVRYFVGPGNEPTPLSDAQAEEMIGWRKRDQKQQVARLVFEAGDLVRITDGPLADFQGVIAEVNRDQAKLKVLVEIFGRETPTEVGFNQVKLAS